MALSSWRHGLTEEQRRVLSLCLPLALYAPTEGLVHEPLQRVAWLGCVTAEHLVVVRSPDGAVLAITDDLVGPGGPLYLPRRGHIPPLRALLDRLAEAGENEALDTTERLLLATHGKRPQNAWPSDDRPRQGLLLREALGFRAAARSDAAERRLCERFLFVVGAWRERLMAWLARLGCTPRAVRRAMRTAGTAAAWCRDQRFHDTIHLAVALSTDRTCDFAGCDERVPWEDRSHECLDCGLTVCSDCCRPYWATVFAGITGADAVLCPFSTMRDRASGKPMCDAPIPRASLRLLVSPRQYARFVESRKAVATASSVRFSCPRAACFAAPQLHLSATARAGVPRVTLCPRRSEHWLCTGCHRVLRDAPRHRCALRPYHAPRVPLGASDWRPDDPEPEGEPSGPLVRACVRRVAEAYDRAVTMRCPACGKASTKGPQCTHMVCSKCPRAAFGDFTLWCYVCGRYMAGWPVFDATLRRQVAAGRLAESQVIEQQSMWMHTSMYWEGTERWDLFDPRQPAKSSRCPMYLNEFWQHVRSGEGEWGTLLALGHLLETGEDGGVTDLGNALLPRDGEGASTEDTAQRAWERLRLGMALDACRNGEIGPWRYALGVAHAPPGVRQAAAEWEVYRALMASLYSE